MHYFIVIALIILIIGLQVKSYQNTKNKIKSYNSIFPSYDSDYRIKNVLVKVAEEPDYESEEDYFFSDEDGVEVSQLEVNSSSPVMGRIITALNNYLSKNNMERRRGTILVVVIVLVIAIISLGIAFAAFSTN